MEKVPADIRDDFEQIEPSELKVGDYVAYYTREFEYTGDAHGKKSTAGFKRGGYVSFVNPDGFFGMTNYGKRWSVQINNVLHLYKSKVHKQKKHIAKSEKKKSESE